VHEDSLEIRIFLNERKNTKREPNNLPVFPVHLSFSKVIIWEQRVCMYVGLLDMEQLNWGMHVLQNSSNGKFPPFWNI